ncbi:MAG: aconitate hydratase [Candidatus Heimdallarchaeaceae archaeon]
MASVARQILEKYIVEGQWEVGKEIGIRVAQTLTQDATGTMAYLQFEAMKMDRVKTELSVSFIDHNTLQTDFRNADDHRYLISVAKKYGIKCSKPGNGICHQVFLERFARPGKTLVGSDSHTPTAGGVGQIAIGVGGLDVAIAMGGGLFYLKTPKILGIKLTGKLQPFVSAKDVILEVLRRIGVKGGVGYILEYFGPGVKTLNVPERATITNMGAETGATTSIFPSDERTKEFLKLQGREDQWVEIPEGQEEDFDEIIEIDLSELEPLIAKPHSPGNVVPLSELYGMKVDQVAIGSCTNSSLKDIWTVAKLLENKKIAENVVLGISPGSRQVVIELAKSGLLANLYRAGARVLENACGPCIGIGFAPKTNGVRIATFNRNFYGRSGVKSAHVYLCSPEVAVAAAVFGEITDPRKLGEYPEFELPASIEKDDSMILEPAPIETAHKVEIYRGPNIAPLPEFKPLPDAYEKLETLIKVGDDITTDHIMPAGAKILPLRSNLPKISEHVFEQIDEDFYKRALKAKEKGGGVIVGGFNYGQGSSREHAALAPMYLGIKAVLVKSYARIHKDNLVNFGIIPLVFKDEADYENIEKGDILSISNIKEALENNRDIVVRNETQEKDILTTYNLSDRERATIIAGGKLNYVREQVTKE